MGLFKIQIAGQVAEIDTLYAYTDVICNSFLTDKKPKFKIRTEQSDIDKERALYEKMNGKCCLWDGCLESMAVHRKLSEKLIDYGVLLLHGAAIAYKNMAFIFVASSGIGKTTHILKWLQFLPEAYVVNGDKPYILVNESPMVCGSPWAGKENLYYNTFVSLKAIILMERSRNNDIKSVSYSEAFPDLLPQIFLTEDREKMQSTLQMMRCLSNSVKFYRFQFDNYKDDCFTVAYKALAGEKRIF